MGTRRAETPEQRIRRVYAQNDKAWKLVHALHQLHAALDGDGQLLIEIVQLMDDAEWEQLRLATHGPIKPHKGNDTSCTVSRDVKALVYSKLRNEGAHTPRIAEPGADALPGERRTGLRVIRGEASA